MAKESLIDTLIGTMIRINEKNYRISDRVLRFGREWQYTLSHETTDGSYESMRIGEDFLLEVLRDTTINKITIQLNKSSSNSSKSSHYKVKQRKLPK